MFLCGKLAKAISNSCCISCPAYYIWAKLVNSHKSTVSTLIKAICLLGPVSQKSRNFTGIFWVKILSVSQGRRGFKSSSFTVSFLFVTLKTYLKLGFSKQAAGRFSNGFSGPKMFRDFRETSPWPGFLEAWLAQTIIM